MNKLVLFLFLPLFITACSVKTKDSVHPHAKKIADKTTIDNSSDQTVYKEKIDTKALYETATKKDKDIYSEIVLPLSKIVLNTKHLDDPRLYNSNDLKYSLQIFQTNYLHLLKTQPDKVEQINKIYTDFISYKCRENILTDCQSHKFLSQDSNTAPILLQLSEKQTDLAKRTDYVKLALSFQNAGTENPFKSHFAQITADYLKENTLVTNDKDTGIQTIKLKKLDDDFTKKYRKEINFLANNLRTLNLSEKDYEPLEIYLSMQNANEVLGQEFFDFLFITLAQKSISTDSKKSKQFTDQWSRIIEANESSNPLSWSNLKKQLPSDIQVKTIPLSELKKKGIDALLIYQTAQDLSAQKSLKDLENRRAFILKNPELANEIFEIQLKLQFFALAKKSFYMTRSLLIQYDKEFTNPQQLLDKNIESGNTNLQPLWMGFNKIVEHYASYIVLVFGPTSETAKKFRRFQERISVSTRVFVSTPLMFMVLFHLDTKNYKEKLKVSVVTGSTIELDAPLLLYEVLQGNLSSFFYLRSEDKQLNLNQYQIMHSLAATILMDVPEIFGYNKSRFIQAFAKANLRVPKEKMSEVEKRLEGIGFGPFDKNQQYTRKEGPIHRALKVCENPTSTLLSVRLSDLQERTFFGVLNSVNKDISAINAISSYYIDRGGKGTIDDTIESVRTDFDPMIDLIGILEKVSGDTVTELADFKIRRDKILERAFELEKRVTQCIVKLDQVERKRRKRFLQQEYALIRNMIAIGHWIDSEKETNNLPVFFKNRKGLSKEMRAEFAQTWILDTLYQPLQSRSPVLYEEIKNFKFFSISSADQTLTINNRNIDAYYRLAIWLEEPTQQKEARLTISYPETFLLARQDFYANDYSKTFETTSIAFNAVDELVERKMRQNLEFFFSWETGLAYQLSIRHLLKQKIAHWKMATSTDWSAFKWALCQGECLQKRKATSEVTLREAIKTNLDYLEPFQITDEEAEDLKILGVFSKLNSQSQIKGSYMTQISPDGFLTYTVSVISTATNQEVYLGVLDHFYRYATSFLLGSTPLYSLTGGYFQDSGRSSQSVMGEADTQTINVEAKDLYSKRVVSLDLQSDAIYGNKHRLIDLNFLGQSLVQTQDEQFLNSLDKNLDRDIRFYTVAATLRELELREVLQTTLQKMDKEWNRPVLRYSLSNPPEKNPWLVSSSYISRIHQQEKEFHDWTKGSFELKKWFGNK